MIIINDCFSALNGMILATSLTILFSFLSILISNPKQTYCSVPYRICSDNIHVSLLKQNDNILSDRCIRLRKATLWYSVWYRRSLVTVTLPTPHVKKLKNLYSLIILSKNQNKNKQIKGNKNKNSSIIVILLLVSCVQIKCCFFKPAAIS